MKLITLCLIFFIQGVQAESLDVFQPPPLSVSIEKKPVILCDVTNGLNLINQDFYSPNQIQMILAGCDIVSPDLPSVLLLHALFARKTNHPDEAVLWLEKASKLDPTNEQISLELASTYEKVNKLIDAEKIYQSILLKNPQDRAALLGQARIARLKEEFNIAIMIYHQLLKKNSNDVDAFNGIGWVYAAKNHLTESKYFFNETLKIQPQNSEALIGLNQIKQTEQQKIGLSFLCEADKGLLLLQENPTPVAHIKQILLNCQSNKIENKETVLLRNLLANKELVMGLKNNPQQPPVIPPPILCDANTGLMLLNQTVPPINKIQTILRKCDKNLPHATETFLLHGLLARHFGKQTQDYTQAINWLKQAVQSAKSDNETPALELAITYEWANNFVQSYITYEEILSKKPNDFAALLGIARILRFSYQIKPALTIYRQLLTRSPNNIAALHGLGNTYFVNYEFDKVRASFDKVVKLAPNDKEIKSEIQNLNDATKNLLEASLGHYSVPPKTADGMNLYYFRHLNATDGINVLATHNNRQIDSGFGLGPTLLPNNSLLLGYQRLVPNQYGWQLSYDARQHNALPFENRFYGGANLYLRRNLEWFNGLRVIYPYPWNTKLLMSGMTAYTAPVNITFTGFWAFQQIGGYNSTYALDLSKEYANHFFYAAGPSYLVEQKSWEIHGKLIFPVLKNQAIIVQGSHYFFNNSTFVTAGLRVYWA